MEVYIEYVVIDNLVIDGLLLLITRKALKLEVSRFFILFSALVGTIVAVCLPALNMNKGFTYVTKLILASVLVLLSGKFRSTREFIRAYYLFLFFTFLFAGGVYAVLWFFEIDFSVIDFTYSAEFSLGVVLLTAFVVYRFASRIVEFIYRKRELKPFLRRCELVINGRELRFFGFIDSGNRIYCKKTGFPVILCSAKVGEKLLSEGLLDNSKSEIVGFYTASGKSYLKIYEIDCLKIYNGDEPNTIYNVKMGVSLTDFSPDGEYDLLLNPALI